MFHYLLFSFAAAVCKGGQGQSELSAHAEVELAVPGSKPEKDDQFSFVWQW